MKSRFSVALGFLALVAVGAVLLAAPFARAEGVWGSPMTALFMACSSVCVTGLAPVDLASEYSRAGLLVLTALVEVGCLGLITVSTFLMVAIGRRLSLAHEFSLMNAYGVVEVKGLRGLICWVVGTMLVVEAVAALVLYGHLKDGFLATFYAVMGFCNAGFSVLPGSLATFADCPAVILTLALEAVVGGIGFLVIYNLCTFKFSRCRSGGMGRVSLHSRVVLRMTGWLLLLSFVAFLALEWGHALAAYGTGQKFWIGFLQAATPRTCGYAVTPTEALQPLTRLIYAVQMFIGGAPGSAAGGLKVTTFAVLLYTLRAMCRGEGETVLSQRMIAYDTVRESFVIFTVLVALVSVTTGALLATEPATKAADALFFEAMSAITTTGLSVGDTTARLTDAGKVVVMVAMFCGRLGALTVVLMIGDRETVRHIRYPSEELVVG